MSLKADVMNEHPESEEFPHVGAWDDGMEIDLKYPSIPIEASLTFQFSLFDASWINGAMFLGLRPSKQGAS